MGREREESVAQCARYKRASALTHDIAKYKEIQARTVFVQRCACVLARVFLIMQGFCSCLCRCMYKRARFLAEMKGFFLATTESPFGEFIYKARWKVFYYDSFEKMEAYISV